MKLTRALSVPLFLAMLPAYGAGFLDQIKQAVSGDYTVRGRVALKDGQTLTCFAGIGAGYLGPADLAAPARSTTAQTPGRISATTAAIPTVVMTEGGLVIPNNCDQLEQQGVLVPPGPTAGSAATLPPKTACRDVPANLQAAYAKTCISFDPADHCSALPVDGTWKNGQTDLAAVCDSRKTNAVIEEEQRYQASKKGSAAGAASSAAIDTIQRDSAAKFAAIQQQAAAAPATASSSDEDLAWDGAKLCGLKPAQTLKLKEQALQFVRYDKAADRVVMSDVAYGARREVVLDDKAFGQTAQSLSRDLGAGGETCARAFWGNEAIKAATAAFSR